MPIPTKYGNIGKTALTDYYAYIVEIEGSIMDYRVDSKYSYSTKAVDVIKGNLTVFCEICSRLVYSIKDKLAIVMPQFVEDVVNPINSVPSNLDDTFSIYRTHIKLCNVDNISLRDINKILVMLNEKLLEMQYHKEFDDIISNFMELEFPDYGISGISFTDNYINIDWKLRNDYYIVFD